MTYSSILDDPAFPSEPKKNVWPWTSFSFPYSQPGSQDDVPRITVITPSFNQSKFIEETIRSVLLQGYPNLEYIIIDGGSTDGTLDIIQKYDPWLSHWVSEPDHGQSHAINKGLEHATGDIVAWLNADDIYLPDALFHVAKAFQQYKAEWIVGITLVTDINLEVLDRFVPQVNTGAWKLQDYKSHGWLDFVMTHQSGTALPQPSSFWSRKAVLEAGGIDETFHYAMDHDLYGKLAHAGHRPRLIPQDLACFRSHQEQKTRDFPVIFWKEELRSARQWNQEKLTVDEKHSLTGYETWFARRIQRQQLITIPVIRWLLAFVSGSISRVRKVFKKLKRFLLGQTNDNIEIPLKGVVPKSVIAQHLPKKPVIVEAGAHVGLDTEELAKYFPDATIYAFEPVPDLYLQLVERTRSYKNIHCFPLAFSAQPGEAVMYVSSGVSDGSSSLLPPKDHLIDHPDVVFNETIQVQCTTMDDWAEANHIEKVDLLWLDMQGHELNALKSGLAVLEKAHTIYTEVNLKEVYEGAPLYSELRNWLEARNFKVVVEDIPWEDGGNVLFVRNESW